MQDVKLTPGSRYLVTSLRTTDETVTTEGTFRGFVGLGNVDTLIMEVEDDGDPLVRLIPAHTVRFLDILEDATEDEDDDESEYLHYG